VIDAVLPAKLPDLRTPNPEEPSLVLITTGATYLLAKLPDLLAPNPPELTLVIAMIK
jgi:hypothetical protein